MELLLGGGAGALFCCVELVFVLVGRACDFSDGRGVICCWLGVCVCVCFFVGLV